MNAKNLGSTLRVLRDLRSYQLHQMPELSCIAVSMARPRSIRRRHGQPVTYDR